MSLANQSLLLGLDYIPPQPSRHPCHELIVQSRIKPKPIIDPTTPPSPRGFSSSASENLTRRRPGRSPQPTWAHCVAFPFCESPLHVRILATPARFSIVWVSAAQGSVWEWLVCLPPGVVKTCLLFLASAAADRSPSWKLLPSVSCLVSRPASASGLPFYSCIYLPGCAHHLTLHQGPTHSRVLACFDRRNYTLKRLSRCHPGTALPVGQ